MSLLYRTGDRAILRLAVPALGALAADPLVTLIDTAFVGRLGTEELGALGVNAAVFGVAFGLFNFLAYGTTPLVANALGRGDRAAAGRVVAAGLGTAAVVGVAAVVLLVLAAGPVLALMGADADLAEQAGVYLRIRALAVPAVLVITLGHGAFRGHQDTRTPLLVALGLNVVNLVLDPLLIFGAGLGLAGAAIATVVAQWVGAAWFLWLLLVRRRGQFGIGSLRPQAREMRRFLSIGRDVALRTVALLAALTLATAVATRLGDAEVAAHQIVIQLFIFLALVVDALAVAAQAMVGNLLGKDDPGAARALSDRLLQMGLAAGLVIGGVLAALAPWLPGWFTTEVPVLDEVDSIYWLFLASQPVAAIVFVLDGIVIGAADFGYLVAAMWVSAGIAAVVMLATLPAGWGLVGVWWGMVALVGVRLVTMGWWYLRPTGPLRAAS